MPTSTKSLIEATHSCPSVCEQSTTCINVTQTIEIIDGSQEETENQHNPVVDTLKLNILSMEIERNKLQRDLKRTKLQLDEANSLLNNLQHNLQFIRDHQYIFEILKETYIDTKYNEAAGKKMKKINWACC